ncbi:MAG: SDR family NAD(P)-dependent oxidoreductase [Candidatus Eisenbacteria bacterium]
MQIGEVKALVTGGGTGIGLATARMLKEKGAQVAISGRREDVLRKAAEEIGALAVPGDVGKEDDATRMVRAVIDEFGDYNVLVNNAGWGRFASLLDLELSDFQEVMATNVFGAMLMARESARYFISRNTGNIINISSTAGLRGFSGGTAYVATKWALAG